MTVIIVLSALLALELSCRWRFPRPSSYPRPQVRLKLDRRLGYVHRPDQDCYSADGTVHINHDGFRGPDLLDDRDQVDLRILAVGNSLTFGTAVDDSETYPAQLAQVLQAAFPGRNLEVINSGVTGFTIRQFVPFLQKELPRLKPDIVLLGMGWRDMHHYPRFGQLDGKADRETWEAVRQRFETSDQKRVNESPYVKFKNAFRHVRCLYVAAYLARRLKHALRPTKHMRWQRAFLAGELLQPMIERERYTRDKLGVVSRLCNDAGIHLVIVLFPDDKQLRRVYPKSLWPKMLRQICNDLNIHCVDLLPCLRSAYDRRGSRLFTPYDVTHYRVEGNRAIAEAVFEALKEQGVLEPRATSEADIQPVS